MLTDLALKQIMPTLSEAKRQLYLPFINKVMEDYEINSMLRASAFLAQIAHESGELRFMQELWGPTPAQKRYDPPGKKATELGNTQPGDGKRYKGRGAIQITGRANYKKYGDLLGVDLVGNPDLAATPQYAFSTAGLFWKLNGLNELADVQDFIAITKRINGGLNGLAERQKYYEIAKNALVAEEPDDFTFSTPLAPLSESVAVDDSPALPRGQEVIEPDSAAATSFTDSQDEANPTAKKSSRGLGSRLRDWFR
jgi:putative chitinase